MSLLKAVRNTTLKPMSGVDNDYNKVEGKRKGGIGRESEKENHSPLTSPPYQALYQRPFQLSALEQQPQASKVTPQTRN